MGGLDSRTWAHVWLSAPFVAVGLGAALLQSRDLDLLLLGEETGGRSWRGRRSGQAAARGDVGAADRSICRGRRSGRFRRTRRSPRRAADARTGASHIASRERGRWRRVPDALRSRRSHGSASGRSPARRSDGTLWRAILLVAARPAAQGAAPVRVMLAGHDLVRGARAGGGSSTQSRQR